MKMDTAPKNLDITSSKNRLPLHNWLFDTIQPYLKGRTLEINSSICTLYPNFIENNLPIHLSDPDEEQCYKMFRQLQTIAVIRQIHKINFNHPIFDEVTSKLKSAFDTILSLDIIGDGRMVPTVIRNAITLLAERGRFILMMPATTALYNGIDPDWNDLILNDPNPVKKLLFNEFEPLRVQYLNPKNEKEATIMLDPVFPFLFFVGRKK